jgi:hypothetical protein
MSRGLDDERRDSRADGGSRAPSREPDTRDPDRRSWSLPDGRFSLPSGRDRQSVWGRDRSYRLRDTESHTLETIGTFHVVFDRDLRDGRYRGDEDRLDEDLTSLTGQGLVEARTLHSGRPGRGLRVLALTEAGRNLLDDHRTASFGRDGERAHEVHAGFRKRSDLIHNASLYRMYQVEVAAIERNGGAIRRVDLEDDLKREVYRRARLTPGLSEDRRDERLAESARGCHIPVVDGHLEFPDVRVEYDSPGGRSGRVDLELVTAAYRSGAIAAKAAAGFTMYSADGCASRGIHSLGGSNGGRGTPSPDRWMSGLLSL